MSVGGGGARSALIAGALLGFLIALGQALGFAELGLDDGQQVAARVNEAVISRSELARAVEAIARDKRNPLSEADGQRALQTLINEELLVQHAEAIGLSHADRSVRKAIVDAMLQYAVASEVAQDPSDDQLRLMLLRQPSLLEAVPLLHVQAAVVPGDGAEAAASLAAGQAFEQVFDQHLPLPDKLVRPAALEQLLPASVLARLPQLQPGDISGPLTLEGHSYFLWLLDRQSGRQPEFSELRTVLLAEWQRAQRERALSRYLQGLRERARIVVAEPA